MSRARKLVALALLCCAMVTVGCGVDCDAPSHCDIREASCQREVAEALQCVRGGELVDLPVHVISAQRYEQEQLAMIEPEDEAESALWYRGLAQLELVAPDLGVSDATSVSLASVAAFYDSDERAVTILDRGAPLDQVEYVSVLAHELVHAQQDAEHRFEALDDAAADADPDSDSVDTKLALFSITEGEAELYQERYAANALGFAFDDVRWDQALATFRSLSRRDAARSDNPLIELRPSFVYPFGVSYVHAAFEDGGRDGIAALYDDPPLSTRQVIAGFGATLPDDHPWTEPGLSELAVPQLAGFPHHVGTASYGSYAFEIALAHWYWVDRLHDPPLSPARVAAQLTADELTVQSDGDGNVVASWRLRFANEADAQAARDAIDLQDHRQQLAIDGRDVIVISGVPSEVDVAAIQWAAPAETDSQAGTDPAAVTSTLIRCPFTTLWR
jgi:hypothetical protein